MTPILFPCGPAEERYNALHHQALSALRHTLTLLKRRFRCLDAAGGCLQYAPQKVCQIFLACCVLHNIALRRRMPLEPPDGPEPDPEPELPLQAPHVQISSEARAVRARIVQQEQNTEVTRSGAVSSASPPPQRRLHDAPHGGGSPALLQPPPQHPLQLLLTAQHLRVQPSPRSRLPVEGGRGREPRVALALEEAVGVRSLELHPFQQSQQPLPSADQSSCFFPQLQSGLQSSPGGRRAVFGGHGQTLACGELKGGPEAVQAVLQLLRFGCRSCRPGFCCPQSCRPGFRRPPRVLIAQLLAAGRAAEVEDGVEEVGAGGGEEVLVVLREGGGLLWLLPRSGGFRSPPGPLSGFPCCQIEVGGCRFQQRLRVERQGAGGQRRAQLGEEIPEGLGGGWGGAVGKLHGLQCSASVQGLCHIVGVQGLCHSVGVQWLCHTGGVQRL
ncbi:uncharacterized protein LOC116239477 isoform X2 [Phasianus colchicus]|uniref:uncharacterized protein LOC116239477 isoform X2 n=1 Tax=Phasianus colchicus TaxID=9054 RepID=UPI00129DC1BC|nr:uncharacterized protein LOC116239477 isoform X2 [Phasianus colchicus]